ncbi:MAG: plastocyanin/azurin family copper-binding protein [Bacteroidota bacterium]
MAFTRPCVLLAVMFALSACSGGETVTILPQGNEMRYQQTEFSVSAGEDVTIVFRNTATSPAMQHNVVVLNTDDDEVVNRIGVAAQAAAETDYIPDDPMILAHTAMSGPGETVEVTFTAPAAPGRYRYICTFPGHYTIMQGTMVVT